jgi:phytoene dehydrogenase-like protein
MADKRYHSVIIGGGMAGLTAASYLAKEGKSVLLIEKNRECGGLVNTFSHNGFRFEAGVRALLNAGIIFPMLKELGMTLDVVKSKVSVGMENEIMHVEDVSSLEAYRELLVKFYPESEAEIDQVMKIIRRIMKDMDVLYGIENPNFKDMVRDRDFLFKQLLPWLPRFLFTIRRINRLNRPVEPYLAKVVSNRSLLDIIVQHFFKNTPAFFALSYFSLYLDYVYPKGGVGILADVVEKRLLELGGEIRRETIITKVLAKEKRVVDQNNVSFTYENLVWAADLKTLYRITDTEGISEGARKKFETVKQRFLEKRGGDSVYTLYLEVDEPPGSFQAIANGHFFYTPSKQGLGDTHWSELNSLLEEGMASDKRHMLSWLERFLSLNTFEISIPVLKDPSMAPEGKTGLIVSILAEYDLFKAVAEAGWYEEFITEMEDRIIRILAGSVYPMLKDKVEDRFSFSPLSIEKRVGTSEGAITGWSFQEQVPVIHKIQQSNRAITTPIPNVFQAGQWTYSPAGVPMSILTGKLAAQKILRGRIKKSG